MSKSKLLAVLLAALCLTGCGKKAPEPPEQYVYGENATVSLDTVMEEGEGVIRSIEEPDEKKEQMSYLYTYDEVTDFVPIVERYLDVMLGEEGFVLVDESHTVLSERPELKELVGEIVLERPSNQEGELFQVAVGWSEAGRLTAKVSLVEGAIVEPEPEPEEEPEPASMEEQLEQLTGMSPQELGLEGDSMDNYRIFPIDGFVQVGEVTCRRFNIYEVREPEGVPVIVGTYLISSDQQHVYQLDPETNLVTALK